MGALHDTKADIGASLNADVSYDGIDGDPVVVHAAGPKSAGDLEISAAAVESTLPDDKDKDGRTLQPPEIAEPDTRGAGEARYAPETQDRPLADVDDHHVRPQLH